MKQYRHALWLAFRAENLKLHGYRCARCDKSTFEGAILQVHHKAYVPGRMPWEYDHTECEALCKGCHAAEHGKVIPQQGWHWIATDDLGDLSGNCEYCGQGIRYVYAITHPNWGHLAVGTDCCDRMTQSTAASEYHAKYIGEVEAKKRFVNSKRWKSIHKDEFSIRQKQIDVVIRHLNGKFSIIMNRVQGRSRFETLLDAKLHVFQIIESGEASSFLQRHRRHRIDRLHRALTFSVASKRQELSWKRRI